MIASADSKVVLEVDTIPKDRWWSILGNFADATVFQTWEYGAISWGEKRLSRCVLMRDRKVIGAAQVRLAPRLPGMKEAYVVDGPIWRTKGSPVDTDAFRLIIQSLIQEYLIRRGCSLRVYPFIHDGERIADEVNRWLLEVGFAGIGERPKTLLLELSVPLEELNKNLRRKWRQCLRYACESNLQVAIGTDQELLAECLHAYREMHQRKQFEEHVRMDQLPLLQESLPPGHKMKIVTVGQDGKIGACVVASTIGDTGFPMLAATTAFGLQNHAAYLAYWEMLKLMHTHGVRWFDFRGIDKENNPGGYTFKTGMSGKNGLEVSLLGDFILYRSALDRMLTEGIKKGRASYQAARSVFSRFG